MIGDIIKRLRKEKGWTQDELALKMGYSSKSTINKIEKNINDVNQKTMSKFAKVFNCDVTELLNENPAIAVTEPSIAYMPWPPGTENDLDEESIKFAHLFQDASEEERALVMAYLKKKQPKP